MASDISVGALQVSLAAASSNSLDPADFIEFSRPTEAGVARFDIRDDVLLQKTGLEAQSPVERDRAIWEYADRNREDSWQLLDHVARTDPDHRVRVSALWAIQKFTGPRGLDLLSSAALDDDPEIYDWADLLLRESSAQPQKKTGRSPRRVRVDSANPFNQTLPLLISGYARVNAGAMGFVRATLSPLWFEFIMGRVMACTCRETFDSDLVIEKRLEAYHSDGSDHFELFKFGGFTQRITPRVRRHLYESRAHHRFYPSGKIEDASLHPIDDVIVNVFRVADTETDDFPGDGVSEVVTSVRGRYMGFAYVNLNRVMAANMSLGPGSTSAL